MTTATPIPPPHTADAPPPITTPPEPPKKSHTLLWLVLGMLALLLAAGVATIVFLSGGEDEAAVVGDETALTNDHNAEAGEPPLVDVPGYVYTNPSASDAAGWSATMTQVNEQVAATLPARFADIPYVTSWSLHDVNRATPGEEFLGLALAQINPRFADMPRFDPDLFVYQLAGGMATEGTSVTTETIDGELVAVTTGDPVMFCWYHEGTVVWAGGQDEDAVRTFAEAYITEQNN